jgi:molybdenum cofactor biosynthesis enzyme
LIRARVGYNDERVIGDDAMEAKCMVIYDMCKSVRHHELVEWCHLGREHDNSGGDNMCSEGEGVVVG